MSGLGSEENSINLPEEFVRRMKDTLGEEYPEFESALFSERYRGLRVNPLKKNISGKAATEEYPSEYELERVPWAENGYYYSEAAFTPGKHPYHEAGVYYIQEPSAMLPGSLLGARPGEKILDLCAAPGGKSTQIAGYMDGKGLLVSNEINPGRAKILSENIERMGIKNALVTNESPRSLRNRFEGFFDRIMVDAPCSGEGMFRKNDVAVSEWSADNVKMCAERQAQILDDAADMLKYGGRMVYSTCTFAREENEEGLENFLKRHPDFSLLESHRLWPHKVKGEGHFAAVLEKRKSDADGGEEGFSSNSVTTSMSAQDLKLIKQYLGDILIPECFEPDGIAGSGKLTTFGEYIYLSPMVMPGLKGLKVLRPGLCLGSLKKDRFEPSHSLALALDPKYAIRKADLGAVEAADYIKGLTVNTEGEKGWTLVCVDGYSLAWGKQAGGILKNHYPKGLRKG